MARPDETIVVADLRGGQNSAAPPPTLGPTQAVAAVNVEWHRASFARKRRGTRKSVFTSDLNYPSAISLATMISVGSAQPGDLARLVVTQEFGSTSRIHAFAVVTQLWSSATELIDTVNSYANIVQFNNKLYMLYVSAVNRLHQYSHGVPAVRASLAAPTSAPSVTESAGTVTDTRKYRWVKLTREDTVFTSNVLIRRSEPSSATSARALVAELATVAVSTAVAETETDWELQVATDDDSYATWWVVGETTIGVSLVDDNASIITAGLEPAPELGLYEPLPSAKYGVVDQNRLLLAGSDESVRSRMRIWFTPVLVNAVDAERYVNTDDRKYHIDIGMEDGSGAITGLAPPTLGSVLAFKRTQTWKLVRTGDLDEPYRAVQLSDAVGCIGQRTIAAGEDAYGNPAVYFLSMRGPYRVGAQGFEYIGAAINDLCDRINKEVNEYTGHHGVYYAERRQMWWWVTLDATTRIVLVFHVETGGWSQYTGDIAEAYCSMLAPREIGNALDGCVTSGWVHSRVPYAYINASQGGSPGGSLHECDAINPHSTAGLVSDGMVYSGTSGVWTSGTPFRAYVTLPPTPVPMWSHAAVTRASLLGEASTAAVTVTLTGDYGRHTDTGTAQLDPTSMLETRVTADVAVGLTGSRAIQATVGDSSAIAQLWTLDALALRVRTEADT